MIQGHSTQMKTSPVKIDPLLEALLAEPDDTQADELLLQVINVHAEPVVKGVIRYKLRLSSSSARQQAEADDIYQEVILQLLAQLRQFRKSPDAHPISDLRGIAAIIAHRTCSRWMRRQFPERHALKNRLHYLLTRQRGLALWQDEEGKLVAGFAAWQNRKATSQRLPSDVAIVKSDKHSIANDVAAILNHAGSPIEFDELVSTIAAQLGVRDQPMESLADDENAVALLPADEPDPAWQIEKRIFLQRLWDELQQLPINQRAALLLNLKDASGTGCITLFPTTGIATVRQLANTLEISVDQFAQIWNDLPLEDARIAELLGLTRQQVINARKSGRERLARRLKGFF